jgi:hypothetical protein
MHMQPGRSDSGTFTDALYKTDQQRNVLRTSIIKKGGIWPPQKQEFISKHLKEFCKFVNSIDFENTGQ